MKKSLISLSAASLLISGLFAAIDSETTSVNWYTGKVFSDANKTSMTAGSVFYTDLTVFEKYTGNVVQNPTITFTIPTNLDLVVKKDCNETNSTYESVAHGGGFRGDGNASCSNFVRLKHSDLTTAKNIHLVGSDTNVSGAWTTGNNRDSNLSLVIEYDKGKTYYITSLDSNTSDTDGYVLLENNNTHLGNSNPNKSLGIADYTTGLYLDANNTLLTTKPPVVGKIQSDANGIKITISAYKIAAGDYNATLADVMLTPSASATSNNTKGVDANVTIGFDSQSIVKNVAKLYSEPAVLVLDNTTIPSVGINSETGNKFADFNVTIMDNFVLETGIRTGTDDNITIMVSNAKFAKGTVGIDSNKTKTITLADANTTLAAISDTFQMETADMNSSIINFQSVRTSTGDLNTSTSTVGDVTVKFGTQANSSGNFASLSSSTQSLKIASVTNAGITVKLAEGDKNASKYYVSAGVNKVKLLDINISENFLSAYKSGTGISVKLPDGVTFYKDYTGSHLTKVLYTGSATGNNGTAGIQGIIDSSNSIYSLYASSDTNATGSIKTLNTSIDAITLSDIYVNIPSTFSANTPLTLTISSPVSGDSAKTIDVATVMGSTAKVTADINLSTDSTLLVPAGQITSESNTSKQNIVLDVNESYPGALGTGKTVSFTLDNGKFENETMTDKPVNLSIVRNGLSSDKKTMTYTITQASTTAGGVVFDLPNIDTVGVAVDTTINLTLAGTAGVVATIPVAKTYDPFNKSENNDTITAIVTNTDGYTGKILVAETIDKKGIKNDKGQAFKIRINDNKATFTGSYKYYTKIGSGSLSTATTTTGTVTTANYASDTLTVTIPSAFTTSSIDSIVIEPQIHVRAEIATGDLVSLDVIDTNASVKAASALKVAYVGSSLPELNATSTATVEAGKSYTMAVSGNIGTLSYSSSDTSIATVDANTSGLINISTTATKDSTVTITAKDSLTAKTTSTLITIGSLNFIDSIALVEGWNLVGNHSSKTLDTTKLGADKTWSFVNGDWKADDTAVAPAQGFWAKVPASVSKFKFTKEGTDTDLDLTADKGAWLLAGAKTNSTIGEIKGKGYLIYTYTSGEWKNSKDNADTPIVAGQGYWIKK